MTVLLKGGWTWIW